MRYKFFWGEPAGCIGTTSLHYPIHDHYLVRVDHPTKGPVKVFQVREMKGILEDGVWREIAPTLERRYDFDEGDYDEPVYYNNGERLSDDQLVIKCEAVDISALAFAIKEFKERDPKSPYLPYDSQKCASVFESHYRFTKRYSKLNKAIIEAIEAAMNASN